ncbi:hypothetical protein [Pedobacter xixiisoli]|uniref:Uncharacterized protein n=1 Tax=Pedobacter xixiisoli TaxID=1476464 RepID=A0A286ACJ3_9SPHI|nr:hypothetical protein [Pedobacter xixiisoli]SOD19605.1 hypothetical protein SAMN06297358_3309 [Pedobacter xixiisoli]
MRILLRSFVFLDLLSLVFMTMQLWSVFQNFSKFTLLSDKIQGVLMFPMYALVLFGAYGLFFGKKLGFISYYIQFPFRLYLWVFTLGFITLLPEALSNYDDKWFPVLLKVCFAAEFIRLYLTIRANIAAKQEG